MKEQHVTVYAADWCPFCQRLISALNRTNTPFVLVDVEADDQASGWVKSVNNGNRIVPTVKYSDGSTATNPPASDVRRKLEELTA
ncbi:NrdH-redoxin [Corynebacterium pseudotuberculosis]|uniref:mycoredoxin n=1 Tax=Corynebacterium pseudotuberculosis TaxID=1719 RepID=UPI0002593397|nr:mycoredoxin [Corynebacterium pseudotuberculosis]AFH90460.1 mycoredoxin [Corynebacterium pseudotuberculosis 31]APB10574.1 NrdH-redoxin [Corynebacterium pseudotuberculosis]APB12620.1 NrdH-redoxin [Corynebacterium pseudotuberculosis]APB14670.1 NrdH-redoxin [Corynebacterium pseudotuberculosis]APB16713.1 NrdH-redoxin [Corynebacterium pseudotuberculosis]